MTFHPGSVVERSGNHNWCSRKIGHAGGKLGIACNLRRRQTEGATIERYSFLKVLHTDDNNFDTSHIAAGDAGRRLNAGAARSFVLNKKWEQFSFFAFIDCRRRPGDHAAIRLFAAPFSRIGNFEAGGAQLICDGVNVGDSHGPEARAGSIWLQGSPPLRIVSIGTSRRLRSDQLKVGSVIKSEQGVVSPTGDVGATVFSRQAELGKGVLQRLEFISA